MNYKNIEMGTRTKIFIVLSILTMIGFIMKVAEETPNKPVEVKVKTTESIEQVNPAKSIKQGEDTEVAEEIKTTEWIANEVMKNYDSCVFQQTVTITNMRDKNRKENLGLEIVKALDLPEIESFLYLVRNGEISTTYIACYGNNLRLWIDHWK